MASNSTGFRKQGDACMPGKQPKNKWGRAAQNKKGCATTCKIVESRTSVCFIGVLNFEEKWT